MKLSLILLILINLGSSNGQDQCLVRSTFTEIDGYLCINSRYRQVYGLVTLQLGCAILCSHNRRCQAFSLADGPCQLFVFDKCSKSVRDCGCSRRGRVFVKQQPGLEAGALCPSGYGDDLCGVKYKVYNGIGDWSVSRQKCESESGLVIMADVVDATEMSHVDYIFSERSPTNSFYLGGFQPNGSAEPTGGWYWVGCNITLNGSVVWATNEPDNGGNENVVSRYLGKNKLVDVSENSYLVSAVLCECLSPFN